MKVGIIGCGLVGRKRASALGDSRLVACADLARERAETLARAVPGQVQVLTEGRALVDLASWFLGDFQRVQGLAHTYFWDMPVEDNGFLLLETAARQVAFLHASWTEWKNLFSFEIFGRDGKLEVTGLGGSYGTERLA